MVERLMIQFYSFLFENKREKNVIFTENILSFKVGMGMRKETGDRIDNSLTWVHV